MAAKVSKKPTVNPLLERMGLGSRIKPNQSKKVPVSSKKSVNIKPTNPLLERLSVQPKTSKKKTSIKGKIQINSISKPKTTPKASTKNYNPLLAALNGSRKDINKTLIKKQQSQPKSQIIRNASSKKNIINKRKSTAPKETLTIKNAALKHFLRITNLETATSADDLRAVLQDIGEIESIHVTDLPSGSSVGEVVFKEPKSLKKAYEKLNGVVADGRVLAVTVLDRFS